VGEPAGARLASTAAVRASKFKSLTTRVYLSRDLFKKTLNGEVGILRFSKLGVGFTVGAILPPLA
jgi:hypothetical protein